MTIQERVDECIHQIKTKGFYVITEELNEATFEVIYMVQKSGEYFLDLTPDGVYQPKKWVLRHDPKHAMRESVIKTNNAVQSNFESQKSTNRITLFMGAVSLAFIAITTYQTITQSTDKQLQNLTQEVRDIKIIYQERKPDLDGRNLTTPLESVSIKDTVVIKIAK